MKKLILIVAILASSGNALAVQSKSSRDPNALICRSEEKLGSRLKRERICMTRAQWEESRRTDKQDIQRGQSRQNNPNY